MSKNSENNKRIAKNTLLLYFRSLIVLVVNLFASRIILETLGVEDYGTYNVVGGFVTMISVLAGTLSSATQRFITYSLGENDFQKLKSVFSNSVTLHIVLALIVSVILEIAGVVMLDGYLDIPVGRMEAARWVLHFSVGAFFVNMVSIPYNALITAHEKMKAFAYIGILDCMLKFAATLFLYICWTDKLIVYALLVMLISISIRLIYSLYCKKNFEESCNIKFTIDKALFKEMFAFAGWNLLGNGSLALRNQGVDVLLNMFFGVTVNAAKGLSNQIQHAIVLLVQNFQTAVKPQMTKAVAQGDNERVFFLIDQGSRFSFYLMMLMAVPIIVATPDLLHIWLKNVPNYTIEFVRWTLVYLLLETQSKFHIHAILSVGKIRDYEILVGGTKLLAVPLAYVFLRNGVAALIGIWVNIGLEVICFAERLYYNKKQLGFPSIVFLKKVFFINWITFAISLIIPLAIMQYVSKNVFVLVPGSLASALICIIFIGLKSDERKTVIEKIKKVIKKK